MFAKIRFITVLLTIGLMAVAASCSAQGFVTIQGDQFYINGQPKRLKGSNYYPQKYMWAAMWSSFDQAAIETESTMMQQFGLNSVRILVPYSHGGWGGANPPETRLQQLEWVVNTFGAKGIRSCVTLFDWETSFPEAGTAKEAEHISYLNAIVNRLKNNPYVFLWDVKNEPDHPANIGGYDNWDYNPAKRDQIISWLNRMCNAVRTRAHNQKVSVGLRWYQNYSDINSFVDVAIYHSYWAHIALTEINTVRSAMGSNQKPILVEEFGWPSHPYPCNRDGYTVYDYTEQKQLEFYQTYLPIFTQQNIAGCMQWMTFDQKAYTNNPNDSFENWFGLWRSNYTLKPGAIYYRDNFMVTPFPVEPDTTPPSNPLNFTAVPYDTVAILTWKNPPNLDCAGVMIRYKTTGYPSGPTDGTLALDKPSEANANGYFNHSGLTNGITYYYAAYAYDHSGNYSSGAYAQATPQQAVGGHTCGYAKTLPNGTSTALNSKMVTAVYAGDGIIYIQEQDKTSGIRVATSLASTFAVGDIVNVSGTVQTLSLSGYPAERFVNNTTVIRTGSGSPLTPVGLNNMAVGGAAAGLAPGVKDGVGLNNIGIFATIYGRVTSIYGNFLFVDDGSNIPNVYGVSTPTVGVMVQSLVAPSVVVGDFIAVDGIVHSSIPYGWTENRRFIKCKSADSIRKLD